MTITFGVSSDPINKIKKSFTQSLTLTGYLREASSVIDPEITIEADITVLSGFNYMYIPDFKRYYFITNITSVTTKLCNISAHVDVLKTYADSILANEAIIDRAEMAWNLYLNDPQFQVYQNPIVQQKKLPKGFNNNTYYLVLAVNGNGGSIT